MQRERRDVRASDIRIDPEAHTFEAVVMRYGVVDTYDTIFDPGCFTKSLEERMPRITWGHDWADVIGRYVDYKDTEDGLVLVGELDDFDAVPRARQAYAQLRSGTIDQFSVGFRRIAAYADADNRTHFAEAELEEASLVLAGSVPGTELLSVRERREMEWEYFDHLATQVEAGEMSKAAAMIALDMIGTKIAPAESPEPVVEPVTVDDPGPLYGADWVS